MNAINLDTILDVSEDAPIRSRHQVLANLIEEVGELAVCINRPYKATEPLIGEAADVINCVIDIIWLDYIHSYEADGRTYEEARFDITYALQEQLEKKCAKWRKSFEEPK